MNKADHAVGHANMWRTVDDFWDNWPHLYHQFEVCPKWAPYIGRGAWPDADICCRWGILIFEVTSV